MQMKYLISLILIISLVDIAAASSVMITSKQDYMQQQFVSNGNFSSGLTDLIYRMTLNIEPVSGNFQVSKVIIYNTTAIDINRTYYKIDGTSKGKGNISVYPNRTQWQGLSETPASEFELGVYASNPYRFSIPFSSTMSMTKDVYYSQDIATISLSVIPSQNLRYLDINSFSSDTDKIDSQLLTSTGSNQNYIDRSSSDEVHWSFENVLAGNAYSASIQLNINPKINERVRYWPSSKVEAGYGSFSYNSQGERVMVVRYTDTVIGDVEIYFVNPMDYQISANGKGVYYQRYREYSEIVTNGEPDTIQIEDNFKPGIRTVPSGTLVTWKNNDPISHTIVSNTGLFSSPLLGQYQQFSYTFNTPGTYEYSCSIHPSMKGKVVVTSTMLNPTIAPASTPTPSITPMPNPVSTPSVTTSPIIPEIYQNVMINEKNQFVIAVATDKQIYELGEPVKIYAYFKNIGSNAIQAPKITIWDYSQPYWPGVYSYPQSISLAGETIYQNQNVTFTTTWTMSQPANSNLSQVDRIIDGWEVHPGKFGIQFDAWNNGTVATLNGDYVSSGSVSVYLNGSEPTLTATPTPTVTPTSTVTPTPSPSPTTGGDVVSRYAGSDGIVQKSEAVQAVMDYFSGIITRQDAISVVMAYFNG